MVSRIKYGNRGKCDKKDTDDVLRNTREYAETKAEVIAHFGEASSLFGDALLEISDGFFCVARANADQPFLMH